jgi:hypothetical protein
VGLEMMKICTCGENMAPSKMGEKRLEKWRREEKQVFNF